MGQEEGQEGRGGGPAVGAALGRDGLVGGLGEAGEEEKSEEGEEKLHRGVIVRVRRVMRELSSFVGVMASVGHSLSKPLLRPCPSFPKLRK